MSEQLVEESSDIFSAVAKANSNPDKAAGYAKLFSEELPKHFAFLEKILTGLRLLVPLPPVFYFVLFLGRCVRRWGGGAVAGRV